MKIGSYSFVAMEGEIGSFGEKVEDETRPGINGHTFRKLGRRGEIFNIKTKKTFNTLSLAKKAVQDYETLCCTFQVMEDPAGNSYRKTLVHNVKTKIIPMGIATNNHDYMVQATWTLQRAG